MALTPNQIAAVMMEAEFYPSDFLKGTTLVNQDGKVVMKITDKALVNKAKAWLDVAIAVCLAESGGNPSAANAASSARGLWQIMVSVHADKIKNAVAYLYATEGVDLRSKSIDKAILVPWVNTHVARDVYNSAGGWTPWEVYNKGSYKAHLGHGDSAWKYLKNEYTAGRVKRIQGDAKGNFMFAEGVAGMLNPGGITDAIAQVSDPTAKVIKFIREGASVVGLFLFGIIVLILGVWFIAGMKTPPTPVKSIVKAVT